jgi:uncharacterized protein (TIGR03437 family)
LKYFFVLLVLFAQLAAQTGVHPSARKEFDQGPLDPASKIGYATLLLKPYPGKQMELEQLLQEQQDHTSSNFHRWLTPEQFGDRFGLNVADYEKVLAWLQSTGLHVENRARARNWVAFSGTVRQVQDAFHTEIHRYRVKGKTHFASSTELTIPVSLAGLVAGVRGLNDFDRAEPSYTTATGTHALSPDDWATIYDVTPLYKMGIDGTGVRIAIIGTTGVLPADYAQFRSTFGLPPSTVEQHLIGPDPGPAAAGAAEEMTLDVDLAGAVARNSQIVLVYASSLVDAGQAAVDQNLAPIVSASFHQCESFASKQYQAVVQQANAQGITFVAASGDSGAAACDNHGSFGATGRLPASGGIAVGLPASIPEVTAVGGTQFNEAAGSYWNTTNGTNGESALSYIPEIAWNQTGSQGLLASGGGASLLFPKPAWQVGAGVPNDGTRDVPDISFAAAGNDPYLYVLDGQQFNDGGTSAATPSFAGVVALLNHYLMSQHAISQPGLGNINPQLYRLAAIAPNAFHDITFGNNIVPCVIGTPDCTTGSYGFSAGPGYDQVTGLGSLDVYNFVTAWASGTAPTTTTIAASPASIALGATVQLTATVQARTGTPTGTVTFTTGSTMLGTASLVAVGNNAQATLTVSGPQFAVGSAPATATYSGDANFNGSTGSTSLSVSTQSPGSLVRVSITPNPVHQGEPVGVTLTEEAGVGTTITGWTINGGASSQFVTFFGGTNLPAFGTLSADLTTASGQPNTVYVFTGSDANGRQWSATATLTLVGPLSNPGISLLILPAASAACPGQIQLIVQENNGLEVQLTKLLSGNVDLSSQLQQLFGTTALAPFGMLQATVCSTAGSAYYQIQGTTQTGNPVSSTATAMLPGPAATPGSPVTLASTPGGVVKTTISVNATSFTETILPANQSTSWLRATVSGQQLTLIASATNLSTGVYNAMLVLQATNQLSEIPVVFTVGTGSSGSITGLGNAASFQQSFAPGMILSVFGSGLAQSTQAPAAIPLPLTMAGVSATVNGVAAPLYYVSPGQINVQIPYETGSGTAILGVNNNGKLSSATLTISAAAPGIFSDSTGALVPYSTAKAGDTLLLFVTGEGLASPSLATGASPFSQTPVALLPHPGLPLSVTVGGLAAALTFVGIPPGIAGATQVNFVVPAGVPPGAQPVVVTVGGVPSAAVSLTITQ